MNSAHEGVAHLDLLSVRLWMRRPMPVGGTVHWGPPLPNLLSNVSILAALLHLCWQP